MTDSIIEPLRGELRPQPYPDPEPGEPVLVFDIEILVRVVLTSEVAPQFFPGSKPHTRFTVEDLDLGVSDWRELAGKEITFSEDDELDASIYLATVHNPVTLHRLRFGEPGDNSIPGEIELEFDFRYVKPRPPELEPSFRVCWNIDFRVITEGETE